MFLFLIFFFYSFLSSFFFLHYKCKAYKYLKETRREHMKYSTFAVDEFRYYFFIFFLFFFFLSFFVSLSFIFPLLKALNIRSIRFALNDKCYTVLRTTMTIYFQPLKGAYLERSYNIFH